MGKRNEVSFYYELIGKGYRPLIVSVSTNGVYFRMFLEAGEMHTTYHTDGKYGWVVHPYDKTKKGVAFPEKAKREARIPINQIHGCVGVETRAHSFLNPENYMEEYTPKHGDVRLFDKIQITGGTNMYLLIGPDISTFTPALGSELMIAEREEHSVELMGVKVHVILVNFSKKENGD